MVTVEELLDSLSTNYLAQDLYVEAWRLIHSAIAAAKEEERERIVQQGMAVNVYDEITGKNKYGAWSEHKVNGNPEPRGSFMCQVPAGKYVFIPASVLSPAPKEEK